MAGTQKKASRKPNSSAKFSASKTSSGISIEKVGRKVAFDHVMKKENEKTEKRRSARSRRSKMAQVMIEKQSKKNLKDRSTRISHEIYELAEKRSNDHYRTAPKTIDLWAKLGAMVEEKMSSKDFAALSADELEIKLERKVSKPISVDLITEQLKASSSDPSWTRQVIREKIWFEESAENPGFLVKVDSETGSRELGTFRNGKFTAIASAQNSRK